MLASEIKRKSIHLFTAIIPLSYAIWADRWTAAILLTALSAAMLILERYRHGDSPAGRTFRRFFAGILREKEIRTEKDLSGRRARWLGATPYCLASLLCVLIFPKTVAVLALLFLAVGDTAASLTGKTWGRTKIGEKSLEGTGGFLIASSLVAVAAHALSPEYPLSIGLIGALVGAAAELIPWLDDNFSIPLASGAAMVLWASL